MDSKILNLGSENMKSKALNKKKKIKFIENVTEAHWLSLMSQSNTHFTRDSAQ